MEDLAQFGLSPALLDAVSASNAVQQGMKPTNMFAGSRNNVAAYLEAQRQQQEQQRIEEEKRKLLEMKAQEQAGAEAIHRQSLISSLLDLSGKTPSVNMGGAAPEGSYGGQGGNVFGQQDMNRMAQMFPNPAPQDPIERLFQQGSNMPKELFDALVQGSLKEQIQPAASPEALRSFFPKASPGQLEGIGRVPQSELRKLMLQKAGGEDRINAMMEGYKARAVEGDLNRSSRETIASDRVKQQDQQFQQNQTRLQALSDKKPAVSFNEAMKVLENMGKAGVDAQAQEAVAQALGYTTAGTYDRNPGMFTPGNQQVVPKPGATAEKPPKTGMVRIKDSKSGRTGWANKGDKLPANVEFVE